MGSFTLSKTFSFKAKHTHPTVMETSEATRGSHSHGPPAEKAQTAAAHWHFYRVELQLKFSEGCPSCSLDEFGDYLANVLNGQNLHDILGSAVAATPEQLARHLYDIAFDCEWGELVTAVRLKAAHGLVVTYEPEAPHGE